MAGKSFTCVETCRFLGVVPHAGVGLQKVVVFPPPPHRFATHKQTTTPHHSNFHHGPTRRHQPSIHTGGPARGAQPRNNRRAGHGVNIRPFPKPVDISKGLPTRLMSLGVTNSRTSFSKCNPFRGGATDWLVSLVPKYFLGTASPTRVEPRVVRRLEWHLDQTTQLMGFEQ